MTAPVAPLTTTPPTYTEAELAPIVRYDVIISAIVAAALAEIIDFWPLLNPFDIDGTAGRWIDPVLDSVMRQRERSRAAAISFYDEWRAVRIGEDVDPAPRPIIRENDGREAVRRQLVSAGPANMKAKTRAAKGLDPERQEEIIRRAARVALVDFMGSTTRAVMDADREATFEMQQLDEMAYGFQRVLGNKKQPCAFCAMLASRGPAYNSRQSAERVVNASAKRPVGSSYHDNCQCRAVPAFSSDEPWFGNNLELRLAWDSVASRSADPALRWRRYWEGRDLEDGRSTEEARRQRRARESGQSGTGVQGAQEAGGSGEGASGEG